MMIWKISRLYYKKQIMACRFRCPAIVSPTMFFYVMVDGQPLSCISLEIFADKVPKAADKVCTLYTGEKGLVVKFPAFTGLF